MVNEISKGAAKFIKTDVSKAKDCEAMVAKAEKEYGKLTSIFNNAGIMMSADDDAVATEEKTWDKTFDINVKGVFFGCKYAIPALKRAGILFFVNLKKNNKKQRWGNDCQYRIVCFVCWRGYSATCIYC